MNYVGADLHKEQTWFYVMDADGKKILSKSISNKPEKLKEFFETLAKPFELAVEATFNWYFFIDLAEQYAEKAYLANSFELKAFAKRHKKTDKIDARLIADVLRKGYLPTVTIPDRSIRQMRELLRCRMNLVKDRTMYISRLKNIFSKIGEEGTGDYTSYRRLENMKTSHLPKEYQIVAECYTEKILAYHSQISAVAKSIKEIAVNDPDIINLITIPGIDYFSACLIKTEIIDINRFATFGRLCAYAGLAPRVSQSADKTYHGPLNVNRRKYLQWILMEVSFHFIKKQADKTEKHKQITAKKGYNTAKVAIARDMLKVIYHVLKEKRPFYFKNGEEHTEAA